MPASTPIDMADDALPDRSPAVITTRRVPRVPRPAKHRTDVSDSHSVPSHPVAPDRTIDVYATSPRLPPCTVTDADPVPPRFDPRNTLTVPASTDIVWLKLPDRSLSLPLPPSPSAPASGWSTAL